MARVAALEAAVASANWLAGIPIRAENRCTSRTITSIRRI